MLLHGRQTVPPGIVDTTGPRRLTTSPDPPVMASGTRRSWLPSGCVEPANPRAGPTLRAHISPQHAPPDPGTQVSLELDPALTALLDPWPPASVGPHPTPPVLS